MTTRLAKFDIGQVVKHRIYPFRGVIFDVDPVFSNSEEWWLSIPPEVRPAKDQPFYRLYAENEDSQYIAYVSEQNLLPDEFGRTGRPPADQRDVRADGRRPLSRPPPGDGELKLSPVGSGKKARPAGAPSLSIRSALAQRPVPRRLPSPRPLAEEPASHVTFAEPERQGPPAPPAPPLRPAAARASCAAPRPSSAAAAAGLGSSVPALGASAR